VRFFLHYDTAVFFVVDPPSFSVPVVMAVTSALSIFLRSFLSFENSRRDKKQLQQEQQTNDEKPAEETEQWRRKRNAFSDLTDRQNEFVLRSFYSFYDLFLVLT
jgi:translation initiation factor RLI1